MNETKAFQTFALSGVVCFFFFQSVREQSFARSGTAGFDKTSWAVGFVEAGCQLRWGIFYFLESRDQMQVARGGGGRGGEGLSCGDGESEGNMRSVNSHLPGMTAEGCLSKESSTAVSVEETYGGVGAGGSDKPAEAVGFHVGGWQVEATESVARSLLQRVLSSGLFRLFSS